MKVGEKKFQLDTYEQEESNLLPGGMKSGFKSGIFWQRQALTVGSDLGYNQKHKDQIYKIAVKIPNYYFQDGKLHIEFDATLMADKNQVSAGVDDLRITAHPRKCGDLYSRNNNYSIPKEESIHSNPGVSVEEAGSKDEILPPNMDESSPVECRVAFAHHNSRLSQNFKDLGFSKAEYAGSDITWGWSNGPLLSSNYAYSFELYTKGDAAAMTSVGAMSLGYDGEEAVVTMDAAEGLWLKEVNSYVGSSPLPVTEDGTDSVDPTDYPIVHQRMSLSRSFVVTDFEDGPVYVVAEATVCGVFPKADVGGSETESSLGGFVESARKLLKGLRE